MENYTTKIVGGYVVPSWCNDSIEEIEKEYMLVQIREAKSKKHQKQVKKWQSEYRRKQKKTF